MTDIILAHSHDKVTADSRMIAEHFEKRHDHVIRDIETTYGGLPNFGEMFIASTYVQEQNGQTYRNYQLTRDGFSLLVMGFTGARALEWKLKYIKAFNEMEQRLTRVSIPANFAEALRLAADQAEILERQKPLVAFAETCAKSETALLVREVAKIASDEGLTIGERRLWQALRTWGLIFPGKNEPYQQYIDRGYFEVTQGCHENAGGTFLHTTTRVLPKGQIYIINRLRKEIGA